MTGRRKPVEVVGLEANRVLLPCGHCDGTGRKEAPKLTKTLDAVSKAQWRSTYELSRVLGVSETNMANRLAELRELGLLQRRGSGVRWSPYEWKRKAFP